jgi:hypothetical protein
MKSKHVKMISMILCLVAIGLLLVWARAFYGSMQSFQKGERVLEDKQYVRAITYFDRSIHWYTPFNPFVRKSAERLWEIGEKAEKQGDIRLALIAFRTIRSGFYGVSHFRTPGRAWIKKSEKKINTLLGAEERGTETSRESASLREDLIRDQKSANPKILWTIVLEIGFLGWIGSVIGLIIFGLKHDQKDENRTSSRFFWIMLIVVFFILWIVGMMKA